MRGLVLFMFIFFLFSCNSKKDNDITSQLTYKMLIKENNKYCQYLSNDIDNKIRVNNLSDVLRDYDSLTKDYLKYVISLEEEISLKTTKILFDGDKYSKKGNEFIDKTKRYREKIEEFIISENLKKRINLILNTNDVQIPERNSDVAEINENPNIIVGKVYLKYLNYYYSDLSNNQALAFLSNKRKHILEFENEFILSNLKN